MPKLLIIETCLVNYRDDRGGVPAEAGDLITVDADQATSLARFGRALFTRKADDPTKGLLTAPADVVAAAEARAEDLAAAATAVSEKATA